MATGNALATIEEVTGADSPYLPGMGHWLLELFPEYAPPRFAALLAHLRHQNGRHEAQIFVGLLDTRVGGLVQVLYRQWRDGLLADIDLLGVLEPYRRSGLGTALVRRALQATQALSRHWGLPALGVLSLVEPDNTPTIRLHKKLGGQIRTDLVYPSGDLIVWHPLQKEYAGIETHALAGQSQEFGFLLQHAISDAGGQELTDSSQNTKE
jgi:GNAT superfamily N-acetyltransferase